MVDRLTDSNFIMYAMKHYDNTSFCSLEEFNEDLNRFKYIKKLITRYIETGELKERLILNHFIILNNMFGAEALCRMVFLKMDKHLEYVKPFLVMLNVLPEYIRNIKDDDVIITDMIPMDEGIIDALRKL